MDCSRGNKHVGGGGAAAEAAAEGEDGDDGDEDPAAAVEVRELTEEGLNDGTEMLETERCDMKERDEETKKERGKRRKELTL